jgi:hypothetical protein
MINSIQKTIKCSKDRCSNELNKVSNDKNLTIEKEKLFKTNDLKKKEEIINNIYKNKNQNDLDLCIYKKCQFQKEIIKHRIKSINDKIKLYNIKFPKDLQTKYNLLINLTSITNLSDKDYLESIILFQILQRFVSNKVIEFNRPLINAHSNYVNCSMNKCKDLYTNVSQDKDLNKNKISIYSIKNDKKRNKKIQEVYSNDKQVKLDKCVTKQCNKTSLELIKETLKVFNTKIKYFKLKIPKDLIFPDIKKIEEKDIPELIIRLQKLGHFINKNEYISSI